MYIPKYICTTDLLFYCSPRPAQKDYFPTKPFIPSRNSLHVTRSYDHGRHEIFRLFRAFRVQKKLCDLASSRSKNNLKRMYMLYLIIFM